MNRAWSFYLTLQVIANIENMKMLTIPASADLLSNVLNEMANFKLLKNYHVKSFIQIHVFGELKDLQEFLLGQGMLFLGVLAGILLLIILGLCKLASKGQTLIQKLKKKIMWTPILRGQIQFYLPNVINTVVYLKDKSLFSILTFPMKVIELLSVILLPWITFNIVKINQDQLHRTEMINLYGPLYENLYAKSKSVYIVPTLFFLHRILLGYCTGQFEENSLPCFAVV